MSKRIMNEVMCTAEDNDLCPQRLIQFSDILHIILTRARGRRARESLLGFLVNSETRHTEGANNQISE